MDEEVKLHYKEWLMEILACKRINITDLVGVFGTIRCRLDLCQKKGRKRSPAWKRTFRKVRRVGMCWLATCINNSSARRWVRSGRIWASEVGSHWGNCPASGVENHQQAHDKPDTGVESTVSDQQVMWKYSREILLLWQKIKSFFSSRSLIKYH